MVDPFFKDHAFYESQQELPLVADHLKEVVAEELSWSDFVWGIDSLKVMLSAEDTCKVVQIGPILNFFYRANKSKTGAQSSKLKALAVDQELHSNVSLGQAAEESK